MKRAFWIWVTAGALLIMAIGFCAGAYVGFRITLLHCIRRDAESYGPGHDDLVFLGRYGSKDDIPSLLYGLKHQTNTEVCTYGHCVEALQKLSGAKPGNTYGDWTNWWVREMKEPVPDWHPAFHCVAWKKGIQQKRSSEPDPADSLRDKSNARGGWLRSLTYALD